jgi:hypothetical protein
MKGYYYFDDKLALEESNIEERWELASLIDRGLLRPVDAVPCTHEWVDARNEIVESGEICLRCNAIRPGNEEVDKSPHFTYDGEGKVNGSISNPQQENVNE